jgi:biopolymer transport protein TolR
VPKVAHDAGIASGRAGRGRRVVSSLAEINVVPLVDVMLVLLIIFMVTAPLIQRGIDVKLPVARRSAQVAGERVEITIPGTFRQSRVVFIGKEQVRAEVFQERVRQQMESRTEKEVSLRGDANVQYQDLMDIIDMLKAAGVQNIGMVTRMPPAR